MAVIGDQIIESVGPAPVTKRLVVSPKQILTSPDPVAFGTGSTYNHAESIGVSPQQSVIKNNSTK